MGSREKWNGICEEQTEEMRRECEGGEREVKKIAEG